MEVGGDLYDFLKGTDDSLHVVLGDVSGKGVGAAFYMTLVKGMLCVAAETARGSAHLLETVNRHLFLHSEPGIFLTAVSVHMTHQGPWTMAKAGHNPPLLLRADGTLTEVAPRGTILGFVEDPGLIETAIPMESGDTLLLYSDGLTEAMNPKGEEFGVEATKDVFQAHRQDSVETMMNALLQAVKEHRGTASPSDDLTLVLLRKEVS